jgi:hypothetical protein
MTVAITDGAGEEEQRLGWIRQGNQPLPPNLDATSGVGRCDYRYRVDRRRAVLHDVESSSRQAVEHHPVKRPTRRNEADGLFRGNRLRVRANEHHANVAVSAHEALRHALHNGREGKTIDHGFQATSY